MNRFAAGIIALMLLVPVCSITQAKETAGEALNQIIHDDWEWKMRNFPTWGTYIGDDRYDDKWTDLSPEAIDARNQYYIDVLAELKKLDPDELDETNRLNYDLFLYDLEDEIANSEFHSRFLRVSQMTGVFTDASDVTRVQPLKDAEDYEVFLARLRGVPEMVAQDIDLLKTGLEMGVTNPRVVLEKAQELIQNQIVDDPAESPIYHLAFTDLPDSIAVEDQLALRKEALRIIGEEILPAYQEYREFFETEYLPNSRTTIGLSELKNGKEWYNQRVRHYTTTDMTADEIHELGHREVERIRGEMNAITEEVNFTGTLQEFFEFLRTDDQFYFDDPEELLKEYRDIAKRADAEMPKLFGTLPRLPYGVIPVPAYQEKFQTTAYYVSGSLESGRAGYFYANTYNLAARPKWEMVALTLHEAVPGHHLQIALSQEMEGAPNFRKHGGYTAFVEGWGLYAESLGEEMGMYGDPYSRFGKLVYEMWRAIRLVVDTGIHAKGWSRQRAIDFFAANTGKSSHDIEVEVDRYIVWPGQALAYKIGQLKILELRRLAENELGGEFDVRDFHDVVLGSGSLPLKILEKRVKAWIETEKKISG